MYILYMYIFYLHIFFTHILYSYSNDFPATLPNLTVFLRSLHRWWVVFWWAWWIHRRPLSRHISFRCRWAGGLGGLVLLHPWQRTNDIGKSQFSIGNTSSFMVGFPARHVSELGGVVMGRAIAEDCGICITWQMGCSFIWEAPSTWNLEPMEPQNWWFVDVSLFPRGIFRFHVSFRGCRFRGAESRFWDKSYSVFTSWIPRATVLLVA